MDAALLSRAEAKARGLTRYSPGSRCPAGHVAERQTSSGKCLECARLYDWKRRGTFDRIRPDAKSRFDQKWIPEPNSGCWLWTANWSATAGYGLFCRIPRVPAEGAHRSAWILYKGPIPDGLHVLHHCDNRLCVNPDHLFLGTHTDNMRDAAAKGRLSWNSIEKPRNLPRGILHHGSKLTEQDVIEIRSKKMSQEKLARKFGVSRKTVQRVQYRKNWTHLP